MNAPRTLIAAIGGVAFVIAAAGTARAGDVTPAPASAGVALARDAARAWSEDAVLVYLENDEPVDGAGAAPRWGYLFYSKALDASRLYSVREDRIVVAENLDMKFAAPPLADPWIDSGAALAAGTPEVARAFGKDAPAALQAMLLMRGALQTDEPDQTTWMLVYATPSQPSLFVVIDARTGKVRRTWRG
jgi:hypothetical protein